MRNHKYYSSNEKIKGEKNEMNKKELIKSLSDSVMITQEDSSIIIDALFDIIKDNLEEGREVKIREFGTFFIQGRKARRAYKPIENTPIDVPAKNVIKFKASKHLLERVN